LPAVQGDAATGMAEMFLGIDPGRDQAGHDREAEGDGQAVRERCGDERREEAAGGG
jgi:hypothetical protein